MVYYVNVIFWVSPDADHTRCPTFHHRSMHNGDLVTTVPESKEGWTYVWCERHHSLGKLEKPRLLIRCLNYPRLYKILGQSAVYAAYLYSNDSGRELSPQLAVGCRACRLTSQQGGRGWQRGQQSFVRTHQVYQH